MKTMIRNIPRVKARALSILFCLAPVICSCSRAEPGILYGFMELAYYGDSEKQEERYSFFILPEDDDGIENLSELCLYHDREGLRWTLGSADWVQHGEAGKTWIGSRSIAMHGGAPLPRGQYRAVLINKGGEKTERNFTFDGPGEPPHPFPSLSVSGGMYRIDSLYPVNRLIYYDQEGAVIRTAVVTEPGGSVRDLRAPGGARTAALWAEDPAYRVSALTGAVPVR